MTDNDVERLWKQMMSQKDDAEKISEHRLKEIYQNYIKSWDLVPCVEIISSEQMPALKRWLDTARREAAMERAKISKCSAYRLQPADRLNKAVQALESTTPCSSVASRNRVRNTVEGKRREAHKPHLENVLHLQRQNEGEDQEKHANSSVHQGEINSRFLETAMAQKAAYQRGLAAHEEQKASYQQEAYPKANQIAKAEHKQKLPNNGYTEKAAYQLEFHNNVGYNTKTYQKEKAAYHSEMAMCQSAIESSEQSHKSLGHYREIELSAAKSPRSVGNLKTSAHQPEMEANPNQKCAADPQEQTKMVNLETNQREPLINQVYSQNYNTQVDHSYSCPNQREEAAFSLKFYNTDYTNQYEAQPTAVCQPLMTDCYAKDESLEQLHISVDDPQIVLHQPEIANQKEIYEIQPEQEADQPKVYQTEESVYNQGVMEVLEQPEQYKLVNPDQEQQEADQSKVCQTEKSVHHQGEMETQEKLVYSPSNQLEQELYNGEIQMDQYEQTIEQPEQIICQPEIEIESEDMAGQQEPLYQQEQSMYNIEQSVDQLEEEVHTNERTVQQDEQTMPEEPAATTNSQEEAYQEENQPLNIEQDSLEQKSASMSLQQNETQEQKEPSSAKSLIELWHMSPESKIQYDYQPDGTMRKVLSYEDICLYYSDTDSKTPSPKRSRPDLEEYTEETSNDSWEPIVDSESNENQENNNDQVLGSSNSLQLTEKLNVRSPKRRKTDLEQYTEETSNYCHWESIVHSETNEHQENINDQVLGSSNSLQLTDKLNVQSPKRRKTDFEQPNQELSLGGAMTPRREQFEKEVNQSNDQDMQLTAKNENCDSEPIKEPGIPSPSAFVCVKDLLKDCITSPSFKRRCTPTPVLTEEVAIHFDGPSPPTLASVCELDVYREGSTIDMQRMLRYFHDYALSSKNESVLLTTPSDDDNVGSGIVNLRTANVENVGKLTAEDNDKVCSANQSADNADELVKNPTENEEIVDKCLRVTNQQVDTQEVSSAGTDHVEGNIIDIWAENIDINRTPLEIEQDEENSLNYDDFEDADLEDEADAMSVSTSWDIETNMSDSKESGRVSPKTRIANLIAAREAAEARMTKELMSSAQSGPQLKDDTNPFVPNHPPLNYYSLNLLLFKGAELSVLPVRETRRISEVFGIKCFSFLDRTCNKNGCDHTMNEVQAVQDSAAELDNETLTEVYKQTLRSRTLFQTYWSLFVNVFGQRRLMNHLVQMLSDCMLYKNDSAVVLQQIHVTLQECGMSPDEALGYIMKKLWIPEQAKKYPLLITKILDILATCDWKCYADSLLKLFNEHNFPIPKNFLMTIVRDAVQKSDPDLLVIVYEIILFHPIKPGDDILADALHILMKYSEENPSFSIPLSSFTKKNQKTDSEPSSLPTQESNLSSAGGQENTFPSTVPASDLQPANEENKDGLLTTCLSQPATVENRCPVIPEDQTQPSIQKAYTPELPLPVAGTEFPMSGHIAQQSQELGATVNSYPSSATSNQEHRVESQNAQQQTGSTQQPQSSLVENKYPLPAPQFPHDLRPAAPTEASKQDVAGNNYPMPTHFPQKLSSAPSTKESYLSSGISNQEHQAQIQNAQQSTCSTQQCQPAVVGNIYSMPPSHLPQELRAAAFTNESHPPSYPAGNKYPMPTPHFPQELRPAAPTKGNNLPTANSIQQHRAQFQNAQQSTGSTQQCQPAVVGNKNLMPTSHLPQEILAAPTEETYPPSVISNQKHRAESQNAQQSIGSTQQLNKYPMSNSHFSQALWTEAFINYPPPVISNQTHRSQLQNAQQSTSSTQQCQPAVVGNKYPMPTPHFPQELWAAPFTMESYPPPVISNQKHRVEHQNVQQSIGSTQCQPAGIGNKYLMPTSHYPQEFRPSPHTKETSPPSAILSQELSENIRQPPTITNQDFQPLSVHKRYQMPSEHFAHQQSVISNQAHRQENQFVHQSTVPIWESQPPVVGNRMPMPSEHFIHKPPAMSNHEHWSNNRHAQQSTGSIQQRQPAVVGNNYPMPTSHFPQSVISNQEHRSENIRQPTTVTNQEYQPPLVHKIYQMPSEHFAHQQSIISNQVHRQENQFVHQSTVPIWKSQPPVVGNRLPMPFEHFAHQPSGMLNQEHRYENRTANHSADSSQQRQPVVIGNTFTMPASHVSQELRPAAPTKENYPPPAILNQPHRAKNRCEHILAPSIQDIPPPAVGNRYQMPPEHFAHQSSATFSQEHRLENHFGHKFTGPTQEHQLAGVLRSQPPPAHSLQAAIENRNAYPFTGYTQERQQS